MDKEKIILKLRQIEVCPICGIKLRKGYGNGQSRDSISLDRINNEKELTINNIQFICRRCNATKSDRSLEEMDIWVEKYILYRQEMKNNANIRY